MFYILAFLLQLCIGVLGNSSYDEYILAPSSRNLKPTLVYKVNGTIENAYALTQSGPGNATFHGDSMVTFDFGRNIGGLASFQVESVSGLDEQIGISFTESSLWISPHGGDATHDSLIDEIIWSNVTKPGRHTLEQRHDRGAFRYLNVYHRGSGTTTIDSLDVHFSALPHNSEDQLRAYSGWFSSDDVKLNRVWYAAAYTNQLCTIPANLGNALQSVEPSSQFASPWWSNSTLVDGTAAIVDGPKRDKLLWSGDLIHQLPGVLLSRNDVAPVKATLDRLVSTQLSNGAFPYFGKPVLAEPNTGLAASADVLYSYTYHLHTLKNMERYFAYTKDIGFVRDNFNRTMKAVDWALNIVDTSGLANISALPLALDWAPKTSFTGHNAESNALLVRGLKAAAKLAAVVGEKELAQAWSSKAAAVSEAMNQLLWDDSVGLYRDNEGSTLYPQDGNSIAVIAGVANSTQANAISANLRARWTRFGAPAPEAETTISPFISGFELVSHFMAGKAQNALDLVRLMWHDFMLEDNRMTNSTFIEGYDTSGSLHYPAYENDARVSHSHGWPTGPLAALTNYVAGLQILTPSEWLVHPQPGDLKMVDAGFTVGSGSYAIQLNASDLGYRYTLETPRNTTGSIVFDLPQCKATIRIEGQIPLTSFSFNKTIAVQNCSTGSDEADFGSRGHTVAEVPGGSYLVEMRCL